MEETRTPGMTLVGSDAAGPLSGDPRAEPKPATDPEFTVLDVESVAHAAAPTLRFHLHVNDPSGREVHAIALSVQVQIDPARRAYDEATRERLVELFGSPERWGSTTHTFQWVRADVLVPPFCGATSFALEVPCTYDLEVAASKFIYSLAGGLVPLQFNFSGTVLYRGAADRMRVEQVPWSCTTRWEMPVEAWKGVMDAYYPGGGWVRLTTETLEALGDRKARRGSHSFDACIAELLEDAT